MPTPDELAEQGIVAHERFAANMRRLDYAWLQSSRGLLGKALGQVTVADIVELRKPFDAVIDQMIREEIGNV